VPAFTISPSGNLTFAAASFDLNGKSLATPQIEGIASEVNKLSNALNEYRSRTVDAAFVEIKGLDSRLENSSLSSPFDVRGTEDKAVELQKLLFTGPFKI
jgi:hypothetical protein